MWIYNVIEQVWFYHNVPFKRLFVVSIVTSRSGYKCYCNWFYRIYRYKSNKSDIIIYNGISRRILSRYPYRVPFWSIKGDGVAYYPLFSNADNALFFDYFFFLPDFQWVKLSCYSFHFSKYLIACVAIVFVYNLQVSTHSTGHEGISGNINSN